MKLNVDKNVCIGCGACQAICPDVFQIEDDGLAAVIGNIDDSNKEDAYDAKDGCPVAAISEIEE